MTFSSTQYETRIVPEGGDLSEKQFDHIREFIEKQIQAGTYSADCFYFDTVKSIIYTKFTYIECVALVRNGLLPALDIKKLRGKYDSIARGPTILNVDHEARTTELLERAGSTFASTSKREANIPPSNEIDLQDEPGLIHRILANNPGICVGEVHTDAVPKRFLVDNMAIFKAQGVTHIFLEHLHTSQQQDLDAFFDSGKISPCLDAYLKYLDSEWGYPQSEIKFPNNYRGILVAARQHGIKPIAIESNQSYVINSGLETTKNGARQATMNYLMCEQIRHHAPNTKWVAFMGNTHMKTWDGVPGVAELTGGLALNIAGTSQRESVKLRTKMKIPGEGVLCADISLETKLGPSRASELAEPPVHRLIPDLRLKEEVFQQILRPLRDKLVEFNDRTKDQDPTTEAQKSLNKAKEAINTLIKELERAKIKFNASELPNCLEVFQQSYKASINKAHEILDQHRGCKGILIRVLKFLHILSANNLHSKGKGNEFFKTDSANKLDTLEDDLDNTPHC